MFEYLYYCAGPAPTAGCKVPSAAASDTPHAHHCPRRIVIDILRST